MIDELGYRRLAVDSTMCKKFNSVRKRNMVSRLHDVFYDAINRGPWTIVKRFAVALYGYHNERAIHDRTTATNLQVSRGFALQEMRQRYSHAGYTAFYDVVANRLKKDKMVIPAFITVYSRNDADLLDASSTKKTAQTLLWDAISYAHTAGRHDPWILPAAETDAAERELHNAFLGARDLRVYLRRRYLRQTWGFAVTKAALLQTNWLLRDDKQLIDLIQTCVKDESKYTWAEPRCEHKARVYIVQAIPDWRPPRILLDDRALWRAVYDEVTRAMSVAIALRHPRLEGIWLYVWKAKQFFRKMGIRQT